MRATKRIVVVSDLHCGARTGLTPPDWQSPAAMQRGDSTWAALQQACWAWYESELDALGRVDVVIVNGDAIDGKGGKAGAGGTELITGDRMVQCEIAAECIQRVPLAPRAQIHVVRGTPFHVGDREDWEDEIASMVGAQIHNHAYLKVGGVTFDVKHKGAGSSVPHGRHTAGARERLWSQLWAAHSDVPLGQILIRSHVHYFTYSGGFNWVAVSTPALQSLGSSYGTRQCSGTVDYGFLSFDVAPDGSYTWRPHLAQIEEMRPKVTVVF